MGRTSVAPATKAGALCGVALLAALGILPACGEEGPTLPGSGPYAGMRPAGRTLDQMLGVASHMSTGPDVSPERTFEIERSVAAGVHHVRRGFYWPSIEPADDAWSFEGYDVMVGLLNDRGLRPCAMLTRAPGWAAPGGSPSEVAPAAFGDFAGAVAARYADRIDLYEIWNEQNTDRFWRGGPDPEHYGRLLRAAHAAVHAADPTAEVIFGGLSAFDPHLLDPRGIWNFLARVGEVHPDLCAFIDGVAIHPYTFLQQPGPELSLDLGIYRYPDLAGTIEDVRGMLEDLGCPDRPIHLTEIGWPSLLIGPERQAAYLARGALLASASGAATYFWYTFYDEEPDSALPTEDYFGLYLLPDGVNDPDPKPAYEAMAGLHAVAGDGRYAGDLGAVLGWEEGRHALVFATAGGAWTVALWRSGAEFWEEVPVEVPLHPRASGPWTLFDQEGRAIDSGGPGNGRVSLALLGRVRYLRFAAPQTLHEQCRGLLDFSS